MGTLYLILLRLMSIQLQMDNNLLIQDTILFIKLT